VQEKLMKWKSMTRLRPGEKTENKKKKPMNLASSYFPKRGFWVRMTSPKKGVNKRTDLRERNEKATKDSKLANTDHKQAKVCT